MGTAIEKSVLVTLSADEIARLEGLVGAGAYETIDDIVREAVHQWLGEVSVRKPAVKNEPVFVFSGHIRDMLARRPEVRISESFKPLEPTSSEIESGRSPII
jgi:Arc/MetJ-type ribon-helix-helix transcriptional regulator